MEKAKFKYGKLSPRNEKMESDEFQVEENMNAAKYQQENALIVKNVSDLPEYNNEAASKSNDPNSNTKGISEYFKLESKIEL